MVDGISDRDCTTTQTRTENSSHVVITQLSIVQVCFSGTCAVEAISIDLGFEFVLADHMMCRVGT